MGFSRRLAAVGAALVMGLGASVAVGETAARAGVLVTAPNADNYVPLTLQNGWQSYNPGEQVAAKIKNGLVEFKGNVQGGTGSVITTLPIDFRPTKTVYLRADLFGGAKGRLIISPSGQVEVFDPGILGTATSFTSLDGVSFLKGSGTALTLQNGWTGGPFSTATPAAKAIGGVVHLKGAVASGSSERITTLPAALRPSGTVYVPIDLCSAATGRLVIQSSGAVFVNARAAFADAQCFSSLDGAKFVLNPTTTPLTLSGGWAGSAYDTRAVRATTVGGRVYLSGGLVDGSGVVVTTLPASLRPSTTMWLDADGYNASKARVSIGTDGTVAVSNSVESPTLFISLDGVSFPLPSVYTELVLENSWTTYPSSPELPTRRPAYSIVNGVVQFKGIVALPGGTNGQFATLPPSARPSKPVYLRTGLCDGISGRLLIQPSGTIEVSTDSDTDFSTARCATMLDGVSFLRGSGTALTLQNGWTGGAFGTATPAAKVISGVVHLKGAISTGAFTSTQFTTLPASMRPSVYTYVPIDLCSARPGRLVIAPSGQVTVDVRGGQISRATCFTSLDGAYFVLNPASSPVTLVNSWTTYPGSRAPAASLVGGKVYLRGAIRGGSTLTGAFVLPSNMRPLAVAAIRVDLCNANTGVLIVYPNGSTVLVEAAIGAGAAQCFTSLDGVSFAR